jgi:hypothetical protein
VPTIRTTTTSITTTSVTEDLFRYSVDTRGSSSLARCQLNLRPLIPSSNTGHSCSHLRSSIGLSDTPHKHAPQPIENSHSGFYPPFLHIPPSLLSLEDSSSFSLSLSLSTPNPTKPACPKPQADKNRSKTLPLTTHLSLCQNPHDV